METEASMAGRGDRSVGMCTNKSLNMHTSRAIAARRTHPVIERIDACQSRDELAKISL
jgi:hypothetical protein